MEEHTNGQASTETPATTAAATFDDSPFAEDVIVRDYAEHAGPSTDNGASYDEVPNDADVSEKATARRTAEESDRPGGEPRAAKPKAPKKPNPLADDFAVDDDEDFLRFKQMDEQSRATYQDQAQEMNYEEPIEDADAEVLESTRIHQEIMDGGRTTLSEQIYTNLETLVPEALYEMSKIRESKFSEQDWDKQIVDTSLREVQQHNAAQKKKFKWGPLHETNIKKPLRAFLMEQGLEDAMSPGGQLLFGLLVVAAVTFLTFKEVKNQNRTMERRLLSEIERIVKAGKA